MRLLLDTHTLLWFLTDDRGLSIPARIAIEDAQNSSHVSAASLWEIAIKVALGKLTLPAPFAEVFPRQLEINSFALLAIMPAHCAVLLTLPLHHRDPFDRMLLAQAKAEGMTLVSDDGQCGPYGVPLLW